MKTFRDLKDSDEIIVKNIPTYIECNITIEEHTYVKEVKYHDEKFWITHFSHFDNGLNGPLLEFFATDGIRQYRFTLKVDDYDKIETDKFKIIQE